MPGYNYIYPLKETLETDALAKREFVGFQSPWQTKRWGPDAELVLLKLSQRYVDDCIADGRIQYTASKLGYRFRTPSPEYALSSVVRDSPWRTFASYTGIPGGRGTLVLVSPQEMEVWFKHPHHGEFPRRRFLAADLS